MPSHWSPLHAMKAYMHTLQRCKKYHNQDPVEPKCMEFVSALAAGNQARLLLDIPSDSTSSSSTVALAIAARHTGGRLVSVCPNHKHLQEAKSGIESFDLCDVVEFAVGDPREVVKTYENVDFAVVDHRMENCAEVLRAVDMNASGSVVVVSNVLGGRTVRGVSYSHLIRGKGRKCESAVLPIGNGMEVIRIGKCRIRPQGRVSPSSKRTFVVYEER